MKITVFGASGKVGQLLVAELLKQGHQITAFTYGPSPFADKKVIQSIRGDVHNYDDVKKSVNNSDVIVSALGSWGTERKDILSSGMKNIVKAMNEHNISRVVSLTGADARASADNLGILSRIMHLIISVSPARKILLDGERHIQMLEASNLDWTVLRSPVMNTKGEATDYCITNNKPSPWETINRQSVALAMARAIEDKKLYQKAPYIKRVK